MIYQKIKCDEEIKRVDVSDIDILSSVGDILVAYSSDYYENGIYSIYLRINEDWLFLKVNSPRHYMSIGTNVGMGGWNEDWNFYLIKLKNK